MKAIEELGLNLGLHVTLLPNYSFCTDSFYKKHSRWLKPFKFRKIPAVLFLLHKPSLSSFPKKIQSFFLKRWKIVAGKSPSHIVWNENENESKFFLFANESFQTKKETSPPFKYNIFAKDIFFAGIEFHKISKISFFKNLLMRIM